MKNLNLKLNLEDTNKILAALGQMPYLQVFELIGKIQSQAQSQIQGLDMKKEQQTIVPENGKTATAKTN